jgi:UDP:flavonoid glycosyltransferase YjiC (YdhE family)
MIMMSPGQADLDSYAENAARLGIGVHLMKEHITAQRIRESVLRIREDAALAKRVQEVQRAVRHEPGAEETANRIEEHLDRCHRPSSHELVLDQQ